MEAYRVGGGELTKDEQREILTNRYFLHELARHVYFSKEHIQGQTK